MRWLTNTLTATLSLATLALPFSASATTYTFTNIVDTTGPFSNLSGVAGTPSVNAAATIAFYGELDTGSFGIFTVKEGAITRIARQSEHGEIRPHTWINSKGRVAFDTEIINTAGARAIFSGKGGPLKTHGITFSPSDRYAPEPCLNDAGQVCFRAQLESGTRGIFVSERDGSLTTVALTSDRRFRAFRCAVISGTGIVAFRAAADSGFDRIYTSDRGNLKRLGSKGDMVGGAACGLAINDDATVAFSDNLPGGFGIFTASGGTISTAVSASPDGTPFPIMGHVSMNNRGSFAFEALASNRFGVFAGPGPVAEKVIGQGDSLFGSTVSAAAIGPAALNGAGQIAFHYQLDDARFGIALATPAPAP